MKEEPKGDLKHLGKGTEGSKRQSPLRKSTRNTKAVKKQVQKKPKPKLNVQDKFEDIESLDLSEKNVIFKPNVGPQTRFLAAGEREVLYGGAAGGGKSYAMLADPLRYMAHSQFCGLLLRHTTDIPRY